jgi:biofilm PGA synthesis N-glycosyltransferase PgaC
MSGLIFIVIFGYALAILLLSKEMLTYPAIKITPETKKIPFSILINYRNEEGQLPELLKSIKNQNYDLDLLQWIFVNDNSTDRGLELLQSFKAKNPKLKILLIDRVPKSASGKKDGITQAIALSDYNHIITTDADCLLPQNWVLSYQAIYNQHTDAHFVAAPIQIEQQNTILSSLQQQEMVALQLITMGSFSYRQPFMCNGANMSFTKEAFQQVNGYEGNLHISSGDDIFLLEKLAAEDVMKCHYLKNPEAVVTTFPKQRLKEVILQRARWAQKGSETKSLLNKLVSFQVLLMSLLFVCSPILWYFSLLTDQMLIGILITKAFTDVVVLVIGDQFFENVNWKFVGINFLLYPLLVLFIALKSLSKPQWQGREINAPTSPQD